jgi:hypothetical protein
MDGGERVAKIGAVMSNRFTLDQIPMSSFGNNILINFRCLSTDYGREKIRWKMNV